VRLIGNGTDDGGKPALLPDKVTPRFGDGQHTVWPAPATAEETARATEKAKKK
jgi:hypothetical protein